MPGRIDITKQTASGESFVVSMCQWNPVTGELMHDSMDELTELADKALRLADCRLMEMHSRLLEAYGLERFCTPSEWSKVVSILDILGGRQSIDQVSRRWHDAEEENAELEAGRLSTMQPVEHWVCINCEKAKPVVDYPADNRNWCLDCLSVTPQNSGTQQCSACLRTKPIEEYTVTESNPLGTYCNPCRDYYMATQASETQ